jgi:hypothetical protein
VSLFVEYGEDVKFINKMLVALVCVMAVVIMVLGVLAAKQRIIYVNPSQVIGSAYVGYVPEEAVGYFGASFISFLGNSNQYSVKQQYQTAYLLMSPRLQSAMKSTLEQEMNEIQKSDMSIQTTPLSVKVTPEGDEFNIDIDATRISYVYGQETKREKLHYTLVCDRTATRNWNPFGLEVLSYNNTVVATGSNLTAITQDAPKTGQAGQ